MHKKILLIVLSYLFLFPLVGCNPPGPNTPPGYFPRDEWFNVIYYENGSVIGRGGYSRNLEIISRQYDLSEVELTLSDKGNYIVDLFDILKLEFIYKSSLETYLPPVSKYNVFENDYLDYCLDFYEKHFSAKTTYTYELVNYSNEEINELDTLRRVFSKYENPSDVWEEYRLPYYITDFDIENYKNHINIIYEDDKIIGFSYKSILEIGENEFFSKHTIKSYQIDKISYEILEQDKNELLVVTTTHLFDEKFLNVSDERKEKYIISLLTYYSSVCVPIKYEEKYLDIELMIRVRIYAPQAIRILKNSN